MFGLQCEISDFFPSCSNKTINFVLDSNQNATMDDLSSVSYDIHANILNTSQCKVEDNKTPSIAQGHPLGVKLFDADILKENESNYDFKCFKEKNIIDSCSMSELDDNTFFTGKRSNSRIFCNCGKYVCKKSRCACLKYGAICGSSCNCQGCNNRTMKKKLLK